MTPRPPRARARAAASQSSGPGRRAPRGGARGRLLWIALGIVIATLAVYAQAGSFGFLQFDDPKYLTDNPQVQHGLTAASLRWAFTSGHASNWHPLTWISHMLDWQLFGGRAGPMHLTSVVIHLLSALLLLVVLNRMTGAVWRSAFVAAMFAIHPLHVESVAWLSERKDVLSGLFLMLTLLVYESYTRRPRAPAYLLLIFVYALGLLSKPMLVTVPFLLLLLDAWPLGRWRLPGLETPPVAGGRPAVPLGRLVIEKLPLLALALASSVVTYMVQATSGAVAPFERVGLGVRLANAAVSCAVYALKTLWPSGLAPFYPWREPTVWEVLVAGIALVAVSWLAARTWKHRPYAAAGWLWFLGMLVPVIGIVQVGRQALADRYTYLPQIGLSIAIAWGVAALLRTARARAIVGAVAGLVLVAWGLVAWRQAGYWHDGLSLYGHAVRVTRDNYEAYTMLGIERHNRGEFDRALEDYDKALGIRSDYFLTHVNLGLCLAQLGRYDEAIPHFREAIRLNPGLADAHQHLGLALASKGMMAEAEPELREAIRLRPDRALPHYILGVVLTRTGRPGEGRGELETALRLQPDLAPARDALKQLDEGGVPRTE